ncbi:MAG: DEAD/DEAH box helicase [Halobacteriovoraceae bacterium]|nr:DEAD/DEAH box helicase [Halobacteriovoraceae bacterium]MBT5093187.1 DEAD/DEAH box helicase [Halobacteriovoraceae bacterium]
MSGKDIFAQAETGSGKTAAFAIPLIQKILSHENLEQMGHGKPLFAVLSPTRELAQQTYKVFETLGKELGIVSVCIIGGESIDRQKEQLANDVHVVIGTPGRIGDLLRQKVIDLKKSEGIVFDEADRLFDMGFKKDIEFILGRAPEGRQLIMVSATTNQDVLRTAYKFHSHPEELCVNKDGLIVEQIDHRMGMMAQNEKFAYLVKLLRNQEDAYAIVFCNTQFQTHLVAEWLMLMGFKASPISGALPQNKRTRLMEDFRSKKITILCCTDVAARGLDIKKVNLVVNYDLPSEAASYVHRIGRTGRAGEDGLAISLCGPEDCQYLEPIYKIIEMKIPKIDITDDDFAKDLCKKPFLDRKTLRVTEDTREHARGKRERNDRERKPRKSSSEQKPRSTRENRDNKHSKTTIPKGQYSLRDEPTTERAAGPKVDRRYLEITTKKPSEATKAALNFFELNDESLLALDVTKVGKKKFFLFGSKETSYKISLKPIFKKLLLPFLINIIKESGLKLFAKVSYKDGIVRVNFSGKDEKMLTDNNNELLEAFDHLLRLYLYQKITVPAGTKIYVNAQSSREKNNSNKQERYLIQLAERLKKEVLAKKSPVQMKPLSSADRRIIHHFFQDDKDVKTSSIGDGRFKKIELALK